MALGPNSGTVSVFFVFLFFCFFNIAVSLGVPLEHASQGALRTTALFQIEVSAIPACLGKACPTGLY